jgi:hypothetical protein
MGSLALLDARSLAVAHPMPEHLLSRTVRLVYRITSDPNDGLTYDYSGLPFQAGNISFGNI